MILQEGPEPQICFEQRVKGIPPRKLRGGKCKGAPENRSYKTAPPEPRLGDKS